MARLALVSPIGVPVHVYQRGNNHQAVFADEPDYVAYLGWLMDKWIRGWIRGRWIMDKGTLPFYFGVTRPGNL